jgi:hypothetical protein
VLNRKLPGTYPEILNRSAFMATTEAPAAGKGFESLVKDIQRTEAEIERLNKEISALEEKRTNARINLQNQFISLDDWKARLLGAARAPESPRVTRETDGRRRGRPRASDGAARPPKDQVWEGIKAEAKKDGIALQRGPGANKPEYRESITNQVVKSWADEHGLEMGDETVRQYLTEKGYL